MTWGWQVCLHQSKLPYFSASVRQYCLTWSSLSYFSLTSVMFQLVFVFQCGGLVRQAVFSAVTREKRLRRLCHKPHVSRANLLKQQRVNKLCVLVSIFAVCLEGLGM